RGAGGRGGGGAPSGPRGAPPHATAALAHEQVRGTVRALDAYGEDVATVLMRTAAEADADLIVMGTSGRHGLRRLLLGSVAESLLRAADRPVLLVRHSEPGTPAAA
ncbi:universal stress protein, partial [Burkholderia contaminans]|uniref:universal stress protein n=1 Tax=Burkholderia contaminans TaxID=488447 RepID=UPI0021BC2DF5